MTHKHLSLTILALLTFMFESMAQDPAFQQITAPVYQNNQLLKYPFAGGLNAPQFSAADLNNDGANDLVLFDRSGEVILTFINNKTGGSGAYYYAPEYARTFPKLEDYMLMRDYNNDGIADIFCAPFGDVAAQELRVFRGYYQDNVLRFTPYYFNYPNCTYCNSLYIWYPDQVPGLYNNFPISPSDYPSVDDLDGDGDLDIVAFSAGNSTKLTFLKNTSVEEGFGLDSLHYVLADNCWGKIYENGLEKCRSKLSPNPEECATPFTSNEVEDRDGAHPGATILTFDRDGDGDKDLLTGNISFDCLNFMLNGGTLQNAWMTEQDTIFPKEDVTVDLLSFPAAFYLDVDNDNKKDLIVCPNSPSINEDRSNVWWYEANPDANNYIQFELKSKKLFTSDMIDVGTISHPAFADVNGDGLMDMVVGSYGYYTPSSGSQGAIYTNARLYLYLNTGTFSQPEFTLNSSDWLEMSQFTPNEYDFAPAFGDLDSDGDLDLLVGNSNGFVFAYFNQAGPGNSMNLVLDSDPLWLTLDVGQVSTPFIYDLDGDGLADILMGEKNGNINFYKNIGTPTEPNFQPNEDLAPNIANLGAINTQTIPNGIGHSAPQIISTSNGPVLVTGAQDGHFEAYKVTGPTATAYPEVDLNWGKVDVGKRSTPSFADLNDDGTLEMVAGNIRGGLSLFKTQLVPFTPPVGTTHLSEDIKFQVSPNPADDQIELLISAQTGTTFTWTMYDLLGQTMLSGTSTDKSNLIDIGNLPRGVYMLSVSDGERKGTRKVVKL